jgi:hypothetical protein
MFDMPPNPPTEADAKALVLTAGALLIALITIAFLTGS